MMEVKPIDLSDEELNFELELRGVHGFGPMTRRVKCTTLEKVMQEDLKARTIPRKGLEVRLIIVSQSYVSNQRLPTRSTTTTNTQSGK